VEVVGHHDEGIDIDGRKSFRQRLPRCRHDGPGLAETRLSAGDFCQEE